MGNKQPRFHKLKLNILSQHNNTTDKFKEKITELFQDGDGSIVISEKLKELYGESPHPASIRKAINRWGLRGGDICDETLKDSGLYGQQDWDMAWIKTPSVSLRVKKQSIDPTFIREEFISAAIEAFNSDIYWDDVVVRRGVSDNLFVPCIFDLHLGKLAWGEETGEDYDSKIAVKRFRSAILDLIKKAEGYSPSAILFPVGNDLYNSDKARPFPQTTNGTPQMDDLRWQKLFRMGIQLMTEAIMQLAKIAPVEVKMVYSNHDHERVFYLGETLSAVFNSHPSVTVDNKPTMRKYFVWGNCLIALTHGHNEKPQDLPLIMAQEASKDWGNTLYREWLVGHLHHRKQLVTEVSKDYRGVNVRYMTSPSAADAWHSEKAFIGAIKGAEGFIYSATEGWVGTVAHNIL